MSNRLYHKQNLLRRSTWHVLELSDVTHRSGVSLSCDFFLKKCDALKSFYTPVTDGVRNTIKRKINLMKLFLIEKKTIERLNVGR